MSKVNLSNKIKNIQNSIVALAFSPAKDQLIITGSGFCVSDDGKILTAAHIYNQTPEQFRSNLLAMVMVKQDVLDHYAWLPITLIKKGDNDDLAVFQIKDHAKTLLKPLEIGDSEKVEVGQDAYFIGFPYAGQLLSEGLGITLIANRAMISNVKRDGQIADHPKNWFIVDAVSNPGNSGCPLIDSETNQVIGLMNIAFRTKSQVAKYSDLDIREPMHVAGAKPINLAKHLLK